METTSNKYVGIKYNNASQRTLCQIDFELSAVGDTETAGYVWYVEVWTIDGSENLLAEQGQSDNVSANNAWSQTVVAFAFSSTVTLNASTEYRHLYCQLWW
jgi:hypothetical protein